VLKATSRNALKQLEKVNDKVLPLFSDVAEELIALNDGDVKVALMKALAFMSGCHEENMTCRSLLNG